MPDRPDEVVDMVFVMDNTGINKGFKKIIIISKILFMI